MGIIVAELEKRRRNNVIRCYQENQIIAPIFVKIKIIGACNLRCLKCNYWKKFPNYISMGLSLDALKRIIYELSNLGCRMIKFSGGEVLLRKDLPNIIEYASDYGISCSITTNGTLINKKNAYELLNAGLDRITISLDSPYASEHDRIVGVAGSWNASTNAVRCIVDLKREIGRKLKVILATVIMKCNYKHMDKMIDLASNLGCDELNMIPLITSHLSDRSLQLTLPEILEFTSTVCPELSKRSVVKGLILTNPQPYGLGERIALLNSVLQTNVYEKIPCFSPWYHLFIHFDGRVVPCCNSKDYVIGNLNHSPISAMLSNDLFKRFRQDCKPPTNHQWCRQCFCEISRNTRIKEWLYKKEDVLD